MIELPDTRGEFHAGHAPTRYHIASQLDRRPYARAILGLSRRVIAEVEQERIFEGPVWNYLCLEDEIANPGDWRTTVVGPMPVVVARDNDGSIAAFENRCAHRGALICLDNAGKGAKDFQCVYHAWRYDLRGNLRSDAFQRGVRFWLSVLSV